MKLRHLYRTLKLAKHNMIYNLVDKQNCSPRQALNMLMDIHDRRINWAYLGHVVDGKEHKFQVRGFKILELREGINLEVSAVNWTLAAGHCNVYITKDNVKDFYIILDK